MSVVWALRFFSVAGFVDADAALRCRGVADDVAERVTVAAAAGDVAGAVGDVAVAVGDVAVDSDATASGIAVVVAAA